MRIKSREELEQRKNVLIGRVGKDNEAIIRKINRQLRKVGK